MTTMRASQKKNLHTSELIGAVMLAVLAVLVGSCATSPLIQDGTGVLAIKVTVENGKGAVWDTAYRIHYSDGQYAELRTNTDYVLISGLKPGRYTITALEPVDIKTAEPFQRRRLNMGFTVGADTITLLPEALVVEFVMGQDGVARQYAEFRTMDRRGLERFAGELKRTGLARGWDLSY